MTFDESKKYFSFVPSLRRTFAKVLHNFPHDRTILLYSINGAGIYAAVTAYALFRVALVLEKRRQGVI